jgi:hypothetical protein
VTRRSIREYLAAQRARYVRAGREVRTALLDEMVAVTGYHRDLPISDPVRPGHEWLSRRDAAFPPFEKSLGLPFLGAARAFPHGAAVRPPDATAPSACTATPTPLPSLS